VLAPTIGAVLLPIAGWRGIYGFLALFGVLVSVASVLGMGESRPGDPSAPVRLGPLMAKYRTLLAERGCSINALVGGLNLAMMFAYITASPLVLMRGLGVSPGLYAAVFACTAGAIVVGSALNGWLAERGVGTSRLLAVGLTLAAASAVCLLAVTASGLTSLVTLVPLLVINTFTIGIVAPNATHAAMQPRPDMAGTAGALAGCFRMLGGAIASLLVGALLPRFGASAMTGTMAACAVLGLLIWTLNFGTPAKAAA
jgi:DHA1 family bicyclomycin/chloramphenicol resistance-like MFS transporter